MGGRDPTSTDRVPKKSGFGYPTGADLVPKSRVSDWTICIWWFFKLCSAHVSGIEFWALENLTKFSGTRSITIYILTGVPSAILEITNDNINQPAEFYARIANNQMKMAYKQGKYLNDFLMEALKVLDEESFQLSEDEQDEIEKLLYLYYIHGVLTNHPKDHSTNK